MSCNTNYDFTISATAASTHCDKSEKLENKNSGKWTVDYTLTNVTKSDGPNAGATVCGDYSAVFAATSPKILPAAITVTIGGTEKTAGTDYTWNQSTGTLTIASAKITGAIAVTITGATSSGYCISAFNSSNNGLTSGFSNGGSGNHYTLSYTIPGKDGSSNWPQYWVGENEAWASAFSANATFADMPLMSYNSATLGLAEGATGTLHIWDDNITSGSNLYIKFEPSGYGLRWGGSGDWNQTANTEAFTVDPNNSNVYWTDLVTLDGTNNTAWNYYVGLQTETGYVYSGVDDEANDTRGISRTRAVTAMKVSNGTSGSWKSTYLNSEPTGSRGKFRIWNNNISDYNFVCHWVPYYQLRYNANGGSGTMASLPASPVSCEESDANRTVTVGSCTFTAPTGKEFKEWNTQADGNGTTVNTGSRVLTSDETLYAIWQNKKYNITRTLTNVSSTPSIPSTYTYTGSAANLSFTIAAGSGYTLPSEVTVSGTTYSWNPNTGVLTLTGIITGDVSITVAGVTADTYIDLLHGDENDTQVLTGTYTVPTFATAATGSTCEGKHKYFMGFSNSENSTTVVKEAGATGQTATGATYYAVWADGLATETYEQLTAISNISSTAKYVLGIDGTGFHYSGTSNWGSTALPSAKTPLYYTLTKASDGNSFTAQTTISGTTYYLQIPTSNTFSMATSAETNTDIIIGTTQISDPNYGVANKTTTARHLRINGTSGLRSYAGITGTMAYFYKVVASGAISYKTSCCADPAEVTLTPSSQTIYKDIDGDAATTIAFSQTGGTESGGVPVGSFGTPSVTTGATVEKSGSDINFRSTTTGEYTVTIGFTETCEKTGSATVTVAEQGIINTTASGSAVASLSFSANCGQNSASQDITVDSRYLSGSSITASIATSAGSGAFKISTDNSTFGTSDLTLDGGTTSKVTDHIYVRYESVANETGSATGTLTLTQGSTTRTVSLSATATCGCNIRFTSTDPVYITAAKDIWVQANSELALSGSFLKTNADDANVSIRAYTNNGHFRLKLHNVNDDGAEYTSASSALTLATNNSSNTADGWTGSIGVVYKPDAHNTTETATLTVEVYRYGGTTVYSTATYTLYGRSLPQNFVIAVTNGSGDWFAVPADMIAPWGSGCTALGTYDPYPITVDNTTTPTSASNVPARAVYTAAARTGAINTNPQTMSYKSVPLSAGEKIYYLYGSSTVQNSDGSNTNIQNAHFTSSEKEKWFLDVVDWDTKKYNMHIDPTLNTYNLAYDASVNNLRVGQYQNQNAHKKDIFILPISGTTCTYYKAPTVTCHSADATNYTVRFDRDRISAYQISTNNGTSWSDLATREITECSGEEAKKLEADLAWATYKNKTVLIRAKVTSGTACQGTGTFTVPNPTLSNPSGTWALTGMAGQAFNDASKSITISGMATCASTVSVSSSNSDITASVNSTTGAVTLHIDAANATETTHTTTLTFSAAGASNLTVTVNITLQSLAEQTMTPNSSFVLNGLLCANSGDLTSNSNYEFMLSEALYYKNNGVTTPVTDLGTSGYNTNTSVTLTDLTDGTTISGVYQQLNTSAYKIGYTLVSGTPSIGAINNMVYGHRYRIAWSNPSRYICNSSGLPYADCHYDFVYSADCTAPTAMPACPVGTTSFTANWTGTCTNNNSTLKVYTKSNATILPVSDLGTTYVKGLGYAGANEIGCNNGTLYYIYALGTAQTSVNLSSDGEPLLADVSGDKFYTLFTPQLSKGGTISSTTEYTITVKIYNASSASNQCGVDFEVMDNGEVLAKSCSVTKKTVTIDGVSTNKKRLAANSTDGSTHTFTVKGLDGTDRLMFTGYESSSIASKNYNVYLYSLKVEANSVSYVSGYSNKSVTCATGSEDVTGLSADTQYYYTLTNDGNESNEIAVKTRSTTGESNITFSPGELSMQTEANASLTSPVALYGVNSGSDARVNGICSAEDLSVSITGANASLFSCNKDDLLLQIVSSSATDLLSGNLNITYTPTAEGVHYATLVITNGGKTFELPIVGRNCPSGMSSLAVNATNINKTTATLNISSNQTGSFMLAENGKLNKNLIRNGDFETGDLTGWATSGVQYCRTGTIVSASDQKHSGTYAACVEKPTTSGGFSAGGLFNAYGFFAQPVYLNKGTYTFSCYVKGANNCTSSTSYYLTEDSYALGLATITNNVVSSKYCSHYLGAEANTWQQFSHTITVTEPGTYYPYIGHNRSDTKCFFLDDVSLVCTSLEPTEASMEFAVTNAKTYAATGLKPSTSYTYYFVNANGCESNQITFNTLDDSEAVPVLSAENITISAPVGQKAAQTVIINATNAYSTIFLSNSCSERVTLSETELTAAGGAITVTFQPKSGDTMGDTGTCTITMNTAGAASSTFTVTWEVASGMDINTPIVEVVDISNDGLSVEHNVPVPEGADKVSLVFYREKDPSEITKNVGDELFFSKYYEAHMHMKLWAIFNPTNDTISLAQTYVWRSNTSGDWYYDRAFSLAGAGNIKPGYICPNEEIIVYTKDQVGSCERSKVDMSNWYGGTKSDQALSYSGDDALLLVRKTGSASGTTNHVSGANRIPPKFGIDPSTGNATVDLEWSTITRDSKEYHVLDLIGARTLSFGSSDYACRKWSWTNCKTSMIGIFDLDNTTYASCSDYPLSTNRCLLIRKMDVKNGSYAVANNVSDFNTLGTEWRGSHVGGTTFEEYKESSCENFAFLGGYNYAEYYNKWTEMTAPGDIDKVDGTKQSDGSWLFNLTEGTPHFYCKYLLIQVAQVYTIDGVQQDNVKASREYKVPIVIDEADVTTNTSTWSKFFRNVDAGGSPANVLTADICADCDIVIRGGAKLTVVSGGQNTFRGAQIYAGGKLQVNTATFTLQSLQIRSLNNTVGYAIINDPTTAVTMDSISHVKRINDAYWYSFSLPYDCDMVSIRQLNGKTMGKYWDGDSKGISGTGDWGIKRYNGYARQQEGNSNSYGSVGNYWEFVGANETLKANEAYIIGLFTTEWSGQHKFVYFPPKTGVGYTETGLDAKIANVKGWQGGHEQQRHHGWNFIGSPYVSIFNPSASGVSSSEAGVNNSTVMIMGKIPVSGSTYEDQDNVYITVPDDNTGMSYTQRPASQTKLEPFTGYFVQVADGSNSGPSGTTKEIRYSKSGRTLDKAPRRNAGLNSNARAWIELGLTEQTESAEPASDNAGLLVSDDYAAEYEVGRDLVKMYAQDGKPHLYSVSPENQRMAYLAVPTENAQNIPLGVYAPKQGSFVLGIKVQQSQLDNVSAVWLLYNGERVKNLLFSDYMIDAPKKGMIEGYSIGVEMMPKIPTIIGGESDGTDNITISQQDGRLFVDGLADGATVTLYDMVGRQMSYAKAYDGYAEINAPVPGSYNIVVRSEKNVRTIKTVVR